MTKSPNAIAAAIAISLAAIVPSLASEARGDDAQGSVLPGVVSAAYRNPRIAANAREASRQGGFGVAGATRWVAAGDEAAPAVAFAAPGVISVSYGDPRIAKNATDVIRQGGLATAGTVRWIPGTPAVAEVDGVALRVGAL